MKKLQKTLLVAACLLAAGSANAQFGSLGGVLGGASKSAGTGGDIGTDVTSFLQKSSSLSLLTTQSLAAINLAFATDTEAEQLRARMASYNKITEPKELQAKLAEEYKSQAAETERLLKSGDLEKRIGSLDGDKKKMIGNALLNFGIGALQAVDLARTGQGLVQKAGANPMQLPKVIPVKDALPVLGKVASDSAGFMAGLIKVAKGANISVTAPKADSKPVDNPFA
jgi:hypothetical protein